MTGTDLKKVYNYSIYPRNSKVTTNKGFVNNDNGSMGGNHGACFYTKKIKNHSILIRLMDSLINSYFNKYQNP